MFDGVSLPSPLVGVPNAGAGPLARARRGLRERRARDVSGSSAQRRALLAQHEAQLVSERTQLAREIHDVLAHTLGATSVQLTALDGLLAADGAPTEIRARVTALHRLVGEGLDEARDAVRNLRGDGLPLLARLERLCDLHAAAIELRGQPRALEPDAALTLYRVAQESLTNAGKHAPCAPIRLALSFDRALVRMRIDNGYGGSTSPSPLARSGGRHGLLGMRERVRLIGGRLEVGPTGEGWYVLVELAVSPD